MQVFNEGRHAAEFILSEANGNRSRDNATIKDGVEIEAGQVIARIGDAAGAPTVGAATKTGTGDGTFTLANPAYGPGIQAGTYQVRCVEKTADSGLFEVIRPDGTIDGQAVVGTAYVGQLKFTIADGAADFDQTTLFKVVVTKSDATGEGEFDVYNPDTMAGAELALAIYPLKADATARRIAIIARDCTVNGKCLVWADGATDEETAAAADRLRKAGIIIR